MAKKIVVPDGGKVIWALCDAICAAKGYLSEIDGAIGDGDHGVNMAKGFSLAKERISEDDPLSDALETLGDTLLDDIGGSMGPIYGTLFMSLSDGISDGEDDDDLGLSQALAWRLRQRHMLLLVLGGPTLLNAWMKWQRLQRLAGSLQRE
jgi:dihydroxyacetone kinase-like protein